MISGVIFLVSRLGIMPRRHRVVRDCGANVGVAARQGMSQLAEAATAVLEVANVLEPECGVSNQYPRFWFANYLWTPPCEILTHGKFLRE
jgi:hypothetical protein